MCLDRFLIFVIGLQFNYYTLDGVLQILHLVVRPTVHYSLALMRLEVGASSFFPLRRNLVHLLEQLVAGQVIGLVQVLQSMLFFQVMVSVLDGEAAD